jgi:hypothetical protein
MIAEPKPYTGKDPDYGPGIPSGSVWESPLSIYMVQWSGDSNSDRCWMLLAWCYSGYHEDGSGGSAFLPVSNREGRSLFTQEEIGSLLASKCCKRIDAHFEPVEARR